jgi:hypothetical protein
MSVLSGAATTMLPRCADSSRSLRVTSTRIGGADAAERRPRVTGSCGGGRY